MKKRIAKSVLLRLVAFVMATALCLSACGDTSGYNRSNTYTYEEALTELEAKLDKVECFEKLSGPDIYDLPTDNKTLADIDVFPITEQGNGQINLEIAAATELSAEAPDDLLNVWVRNFNKRGGYVQRKDC